MNCKFCNGLNIKKKGFLKSGKQIYYCKDCHKTFSVLKDG